MSYGNDRDDWKVWCNFTALVCFRQGRQLNWISRNDWLKPVATVRLPSLPAEGSERKLGAIP